MISSGKSTCKDCNKRYIGCHGSCEEYLAFKSEKDSVKKMSAETNDISLKLRDEQRTKLLLENTYGRKRS